MATPARETRQSALNSEDELYGGRQRSRRLPVETNNDSIVWDLNDDGRPKTRRVNPQRLALRLDPALVAEMEAYIVPGAKMPPFSVRKDFQERYSVDRRHIYDYFHSRGLRVAKEDKHTNLIRGRAMKAKALAQTLLVSQIPTKASSEATEEIPVDKTRSLFTNERSRTTKRPSKIRESKSAIMRRSTTYIKPVKKSHGPVCAIPDSLLGQLPSEIGGELSISGTDNDWDSESTSPQFTLASASSDESIVTSAASDFLPSPNDFLAGFFGGPDHLPQNFSEIESFSVDEKHNAVDQERLLTKGERTELYDLISGSISSSVSVAGRPSDILLSVNNTNRGGRQYPRENAGKSHLACSTCLNALEATHGVHDLKTWLSDDLDLQLALETHFLPSLRDSLDGYAWFHDASVVNNDYGMTGDYSQAGILSSQNRLPSSKVPISVACIKQHIPDHSKKDAENVHPGVLHYFR